MFREQACDAFDVRRPSVDVAPTQGTSFVFSEPTDIHEEEHHGLLFGFLVGKKKDATNEAANEMHEEDVEEEGKNPSMCARNVSYERDVFVLHRRF